MADLKDLYRQAVNAADADCQLMVKNWLESGTHDAVDIDGLVTSMEARIGECLLKAAEEQKEAYARHARAELESHALIGRLREDRNSARTEVENLKKAMLALMLCVDKLKFPGNRAEFDALYDAWFDTHELWIGPDWSAEWKDCVKALAGQKKEL